MSINMSKGIGSSCVDVFFLSLTSTALLVFKGFNLRSYCFRVCFLLIGFFCLNGCQASPEIISAPVTGFNHTSSNINSFTINGAGGPNIAPFQGGGKQVCCSAIPAVWNSGMKAVIEWETDPDPYAYGKWTERLNSEAWKKRMQAHEKNYKKHTAEIAVPKYGSEVCALQVHFLPCDQVRVSTTCFTPSSPNYPDNAYFQMKEPTTCSTH